MMVGAGGQLLERSLIDRSVFGAERLVFEGPPILKSPLQQDRESRRPVAVDGEILDSVTAFPPLNIVDNSKLDELKDKQRHRLAAEVGKVRNAFVKLQAERILKRTGMSQRAAERIASRHRDGVLLPSVELPFDDREFAGCTVADVLADPDRFEGATLADPLEGVVYGTCKAKIMRQSDGTPWIHSFAHGRSIYHLKWDAAAVHAAMQKADADEVAKVFVELAVTADLDPDEVEQLIDEAVKRSGTKKMTVKAMLKKKLQQHAARQAKKESQRRASQRTDPRPQINSPDNDAPWLPMMEILNHVLGVSSAEKPPSRNVDGNVVRARKMIIPETHAYSDGGNDGTKEPPEQWALSSLNEMELAEMIETYIDFVDGTSRPVHLPMPFVRHYLQRDDQALPTVVGLAMAPIVLADGEILAPEGLDRKSGIIFEIPKDIRAILPRREDCTDEAVKDAMHFLCDEWQCDVNTDFAGKAIIIAAALTIIERSLLDNRPAFFVTAGKRSSGKGTTVEMVTMAAMGVRAAMQAWSTNVEERRKQLPALFLLGVGYIAWDNIELGSQISCPHIERACTAKFYSDRKLGNTEMINAAASAIHLFTGNNIGPRGDLASRSLIIRIAVDRPDPENRDFKHIDPIGWTESNRADILRAFYTILLGNPQLKQPRDAPAKTRFKLWWRLIGSAMEHATKLYAGKDALDFKELFVRQEETQDEDSVSLADILDMMLKKWPDEFSAADVAELINDELVQGAPLRNFLYPNITSTDFVVSTVSVGIQLSKYLDNAVTGDDGQILTLRERRDRHRNRTYSIELKPKPSTTPS